MKYIANPRDPLTLRYARTLDETRRDPYAWGEGHVDLDALRALSHPLLDEPRQPAAPWLSGLKTIFVRLSLRSQQ